MGLLYSEDVNNRSSETGQIVLKGEEYEAENCFCNDKRRKNG